MVSLRKTRNNKISLRKKRRSAKKSQQQKQISLEKLKEEIKADILQNLQKTEAVENKNKPISGHVSAGEKWDQSESGKQWKNQIDEAQNQLDRLLKEKQMNMTASGKYARMLASKKRNYPELAEKFADDIVKEIIVSKTKKAEQQANKLPKPVSPVKLAPQTVDPIRPPELGGFFDDSSSDEEDQL